MKSRPFIILFLLSFLLFSVASGTISAYAKSEIEQNLKDEIQSSLNSIISEEIEQYVYNLSLNGQKISLKQLINDLINGEGEIKLNNLFDYLTSSITTGLKSTLFSMLSIIVLSILSGLSASLTSGFKKEGTKNIIHLTIYGAIVCTLAFSVATLVQDAIKTINVISDVFDLSFPIILTLLTAVGGKSSIMVFESVTTIYSNLLIKTITNVISPLFCAITIFTFVGNLTDTVKLEKLSKSFRSIANWTLGISFSLLTTLVTIQGVVGVGFDNITIKSAKFALSNYVPILGGYLSEGFDIVLASLVVIKNAFGFAIFFIIILLVLTPIIKILTFSFGLKLISGFVEIYGQTKISSLLYDLSSNFNLLIATLGGVFFMVFIFTILLTSAFNGGVV